jgi:hypothetical protein
MAEPAPSSWRTSYKWAILESDPAKRHARIHEALKAIEERLCDPVGIDDTETTELDDALKALAILMAVRGEKAG